MILLKRDSNTDISCEYWEIYKKTYFEEHLRMAALLESVLWERFSDQNLVKGTTDVLLCEGFLKLVNIEQKYFL